MGKVSYVTDSSGAITKVTHSYVPYYNQANYGVSYNGLSFASTGCTPTVLAMLFGGLYGASYSPTYMADLLYAAGLMNNGVNGCPATSMSYIANRFGKSITTSLSSSQAKNILLRGGMITAAMNPGTFCVSGATHEILIFGYDNGTVKVYDPLWSGHNGSYSLGTIYGQLSTAWEDNVGGGPVFGWV